MDRSILELLTLPELHTLIRLEHELGNERSVSLIADRILDVIDDQDRLRLAARAYQRKPA